MHEKLKKLKSPNVWGFVKFWMFEFFSTFMFECLNAWNIQLIEIFEFFFFKIWMLENIFFLCWNVEMHEIVGF